MKEHNDDKLCFLTYFENRVSPHSLPKNTLCKYDVWKFKALAPTDFQIMDKQINKPCLLLYSAAIQGNHIHLEGKDMMANHWVN